MAGHGFILIFVLLPAALIPGAAQARGQATDTIRAGNDAAVTRTSSSELPAPHDTDSVAASGTQYLPALDGSGLFSLDTQRSTHLLLGATVAGGSDSNPNNVVGGAPTGVFTLNPYLGLQASTPRAQYLLQYQATDTHFSSEYAAQNMNVASFNGLGHLNARWSWELNAGGNYGQDSARFLGAQQTVAVGEVPGTAADSASYLANAGTVTHVSGGIGARYRRSERDSLLTSASYLFTRYAGLGSTSEITSLNLTYERAMSPTRAAFVYANSTSYSGSRSCESFGAGVGIRLIREHTTFSASGGPQGNTAACQTQQGFAYSVAFSTRLTGRSQVYLLAARQPTSSFLGPGLWQDNVSGGYQRQVLRRGLMSADAGYVSSDTLTAVQSYKGLYVDAVYRVLLARGWHAVYSYRGYFGDTGSAPFHRNVALVSIVWSPGESRVMQ